MGFIWVQFLSPLHYPVPGVRCELSGGGCQWPAQLTSDTEEDLVPKNFEAGDGIVWPTTFLTPRVTSEKGCVKWPVTMLDTYEVKLALGQQHITTAVPWLRTDDNVHEQRLMHLHALLGGPHSDAGTQVRLTGLGYYCDKIDGNLKSGKTLEALKKFQQEHGLEDHPFKEFRQKHNSKDVGTEDQRIKRTQELLAAIYGA
jgi:hypothetical protein